jgi:hypothetical protein
MASAKRPAPFLHARQELDGVLDARRVARPERLAGLGHECESPPPQLVIDVGWPPAVDFRSL